MLDYPEFDYSLIEDVDAWYIYTLASEEDRKQLLGKLEGVEEKERANKAKKLML